VANVKRSAAPNFRFMSYLDLIDRLKDMIVKGGDW
jgi:hypothetical protein